MPLILESLRLALHSLRRVYEESQTHENASFALYEPQLEIMKCYDSTDAVNALSCKGFLPTAHEYKLIADPKLWFGIHVPRKEE